MGIFEREFLKPQVKDNENVCFGPLLVTVLRSISVAMG